jgi:hypothetical protein
MLTGKSDPALIDDYLKDKKAIWSMSRNIKVKGYSVELYAQDSDDNLVAAGVYSLRDNKWIKKPIHGKYDFKHDEALQDKVDELKTTIDDMIKDKLPADNFRIMKDKIKNMRKAALASGNEFSFENLIFKEIRNLGVLDRMNKYLQGVKDREYSLD